MTVRREQQRAPPTTCSKSVAELAPCISETTAALGKDGSLVSA